MQSRSSYVKGEFIETEPRTDCQYIGDTAFGEEKLIYFGCITHLFVQQFAGETRGVAHVNLLKPLFFTEVSMWRLDNCLGSYKWTPYHLVRDECK